MTGRPTRFAGLRTTGLPVARGRGLLAPAAIAAILCLPLPLSGQYRVVSPAGDSILLETAKVRVMLDTTRALRKDLEEDPRVMYVLGFGDRATERDLEPAWPWNAATVQSDSVIQVVTPGNLREADRAYENYSVMRMRVVRSKDPDAPCDSIVAWEVGAVSSFIDGWIVARTLFGGPAYGPLDAMAFARLDGHLPALIVDLGDRQIGACAAEWAESHPEAIDEYRSWHERQFPESSPEPRAPGAGEETPTAEPAPAATDGTDEGAG